MQILESILQQMIGCTVRIADGSIYHNNWVTIEAIVDADFVRVQADNWNGLCSVSRFFFPLEQFSQMYYTQLITDIVPTHVVDYYNGTHEYQLYLNETEHQLLKRGKNDAND